MREIDLVFIILEGMSKSESIVVACKTHVLFFIVVLKVRDISANTMPTKVLFFLSSNWKREDPHAVIIKWITLRKIIDVEFNLIMLVSVTHPKEVPLSMSVGVNIVL